MTESIPVVEERKVEQNEVEVLAGLIKNQVASIDKLKLELKNDKLGLNDKFMEDGVYKNALYEVDKANSHKRTVRQRMLSQPVLSQLAQKIKDSAFDLKEKKQTLSDLLNDYRDKTKATQLELFNGVTVDIVQTATVKRK